MSTALKRRIGPGLLTAYGVGVMVGAGIYVLVGAVAAEAGLYAPLAFLLAGLASVTSVVLLIVFALVNGALIAVKRKSPSAPFLVAVWVPWTGLILSLATLVAFAMGAAV